MKYNFDEVLDRRGTLSHKWDGMEEGFPRNPQAIPLWVADMDFPCPRPVVEAVCRRAAHPVYGYSDMSIHAKELAAAWQEKKNGWKAKPEWVTFSNGIVPALSAMVAAFTEPGEGVIIQPPVYYPFRDSVVNNDRKLVENPLVFDGEKWGIHFDELEELAADPANRLLLLCHPLNPVSRVLNEKELKRIGDICLRNHVIVAVDEIHSDLTYRHKHFYSLAGLGEAYEQISATAMAPSKVFNIAGLQTSAILIPNEDLREAFIKEMDKRVYIPNLFGAAAFDAAYSDPECEEYLEQLLTYLWENYLFVDGYLKKWMPKITCQKPDATYLLWLDCRQLCLNDEDLERFWLEEAGLALDAGRWFGKGGSGFMRMNIGCARSLLEKGLGQLREVYRKRKF